MYPFALVAFKWLLQTPEANCGIWPCLSPTASMVKKFHFLFTIKEISGLDYMAYYRNAEALALFRSHSTHLRKQREIAQSKRRGATRPPSEEQEAIVPSRDPLLHYKKPRLVAELRAARAKHDQMEQQYQALLQEHMHCG